PRSAGNPATHPNPAAPTPASPTTSAPATGSPTCRSGASAATSFGLRFLPGGVAPATRSRRLRVAAERSGAGGAPDRRLKTLWRRAGAPPFPRERLPEARTSGVRACHRVRCGYALGMFDTAPQLDCAGRILKLDRPRVMGIVNVTPDSFSDGGEHASLEQAVAHGLRLAEEG